MKVFMKHKLLILISAILLIYTFSIAANIRFTTATGAGAIATAINPGAPWQLEGIRLHLSAAGGAGNLTITVDHGNGSAYDAVILTQDMTAVTDLVWSPERPMQFPANTEVDISYANANGRTYGLEVGWTPLF